MAGYLIAEEGPLAGLTLHFEEGSEWVLGRDPDVSTFVLEDPMVSRRHVICRLNLDGYSLENLSTVNPATQNGKIISDPVLLQEGDILQIGNTFFRFTEKKPINDKDASAFLEDPESLSSIQVSSLPHTRWLLKVVSGPNSGAEFPMQKGGIYTLGKDPHLCDVVFQDLSVSRQHARLSISSEEEVFIEDLGSKNQTLVNGIPIKEKYNLSSQDLVALGTTSFLVIDQTQASHTLISPGAFPIPEKQEASADPENQEHSQNFRDMVISKKHLSLFAVLGFILLVSFVGVLSLFQSEPLVSQDKHEREKISEIVHHYPDVQFSYNQGSGKLFLTGHLLTSVEKQELLYQLRGLGFLQNIDDTVVIDEYVWQNMNALLAINNEWQGIVIQAPSAGHFVIRGYLQTPEQAQALFDYLNMNFPYLDKLENQVVVEGNLKTQIDSILLENGFNNITYQLSNGELVLSGRVDEKESSSFETFVKELKGLQGIRSLKNFVLYTKEDSATVDLSSKYKVMGYSRKDGESQYVVINGKILSSGDLLEGMLITSIHPNFILLEKDGLKFRINYNVQ